MIKGGSALLGDCLALPLVFRRRSGRRGAARWRPLRLGPGRRHGGDAAGPTQARPQQATVGLWIFRGPHDRPAGGDDAIA